MNINNQVTNGGGFVYLVTHENAVGLHKIGLTRSPAERLKQLEINGVPVEVIAMVLTANPEVLERELHQSFATRRVPQSEWFRLSKEDMNEACSRLCKAHREATKYVVLPITQKEKNEAWYKKSPPPVSDEVRKYRKWLRS